MTDETVIFFSFPPFFDVGEMKTRSDRKEISFNGYDFTTTQCAVMSEAAPWSG